MTELQQRTERLGTFAVLAIVAVLIVMAAGDQGRADSGESSASGESKVFAPNPENLPRVDEDSGFPGLEDPEVSMIADIHRVNRQQAQAILGWMFRAEHGLLQIRSAFPEGYAGAEFVHLSGEIRLDIYVKGPTEPVADLAIELMPTATYASVEVREAQRSERELVSEAEQIADQHEQLFGIRPNGSLNFKTGRFDIHIGETVVRSSHNACTHGDGGWLEGGQILRIASTQTHYDQSDGCTPQTSRCTTGFASMLDGYYGLVTAGHCLAPHPQDFKNVTMMDYHGNELRVSLRTHKWDSYPDDDIGFARRVYSNAQPRGRVFIGTYPGYRNINSLLPYAPPNGASRCIKSAAPDDLGSPADHAKGHLCGTVVVGNYCFYGFCRYTAVDNPAWPGTSPNNGSSGGPWFTGTSATGIHHGKTWPGQDALYYRLDWAKNTLGPLSLFCNGTSDICAWP